MDKIRLKEDNIVRIAIETAEGVDTGEVLEFDLEDISLPLRYQECIQKHKENLLYLQNIYGVIDKRPDKQGKKLLSANEEAKIRELQKFVNKEMQALDLFLGENGTKKLLNGRKPYFSMFDDIKEILTPVLPILDKSASEIDKKIKEKYKDTEENGVLE